MSEYICPHCKQPIFDDEALLCHYCGESLNRGSHEALGKIKDARIKWLVVIIVVLVIVSFLVFMR